jgi:dUTP pyrophosphatase
MTTRIQFLTTRSGAIKPKYAHPGDAGLDLFSADELTLRPNTRTLVGTGIALILPLDLEAQIRSRSGLAFNHGIIVFNAPGTIDPTYRGEIKVILYNASDENFRIDIGMRIAQMVIAPLTKVQLVETVDFGPTERGNKGFGSTGV